MADFDCRAVEERLPWYLHGGLVPEEQRSIARHLESCPACREALAATGEASALFAAHPPAEFLVDYAFGLEIPAAERTTLELHLAHCAECRDELDGVASRPSAVGEERSGDAVDDVPGARPLDRNRFRTLALAASVVLAAGLSVWLATAFRNPAGAGRVAVVELLPDNSSTRGAIDEELGFRASEATTLLLVTDRAESFDEVRAGISTIEGQELRRWTNLLPAMGGGYALLLPANAVAPGEIAIHLEGRRGEIWSPVSSYRATVEP
ncbi:MAG: zf-HC2 domain-containing protein [Thermoanaerobaculia bacterium]